ncbi:Putative PQQ enzyme repeat [Thermococcus sp. 2319x1]|uniref:Lcl domain-containing protein n=1 Tax=Thermococcus sp. 2319x1 TaxID=1674923 RepID=UPI00073A8D19|nr:DUF1566 domain-containing protein [Thermococcus sp. 2319x1]ALV63477.1 Putative PQQ enzyme repeat [Thermococcus sp. 2319x1]
MRKGLFALALTALLIGAVGYYIFSTGTGTSEGTGTEGHGEETQLESIKTPYPYTVVDTGQEKCYDTSGKEIACPEPGEPLYGQDAQYEGYQPKYRDNGDGTVTDLNTGLMWTRSPDWNGDGEINYEDKMTYEEALEFVKKLNEEKYLGYDDWRLPSIKELYSLIVFSGVDPSGYDGADTSKLVPFIDTNYFEFAYGDTKAGERIIDAQFLSSTRYVGKVMRGQEAVFGVNFADGRIKAYPITKKFYVLFVRGNPDYGKNDFVDNGDGTITDRATGLMWTKNDSGYCMNWEEALEYVQRMNEENYLGYSDWRLPNAKELQSIVDYTRAPDAVNPAQRGPAIDPIFNVTPITNEAGELDYPYYWTSTTHVSMFGGGRNAVYIAFGRALGWMNTPQGYKLMDVHGAGAQRSDPKTGDPSRYPYGHGPQGDVVRICAFVRLVRDANVTPASNESSSPGVDYQGLGGENNTGVVLKSENATEGYILFSPLSSKKTYLINYDGAVIHSWATQYFPGQNAYLLENGHLLRTGKVEDSPFSKAGGAGGVVQEFNWKSNLLWEFRYCSENYCTHHDIEPLPNGNILMIVWDKKSRAEAIENGMNPELVPEEGIWSECIIEVKLEGKEGGEIVWKWCAWNHLIQEYDPSKPNYGDVEEHPERINLNYKGLTPILLL